MHPRGTPVPSGQVGKEREKRGSEEQLEAKPLCLFYPRQGQAEIPEYTAIMP